MRSLMLSLEEDKVKVTEKVGDGIQIFTCFRDA